MKPIRFLLASVALAIASLSAKAQSADSIRFRIVDEAGDPIAYAVAVAVNEADSTASAPAFSSESGDVTIQLGSATYTVLKVQCMGFVPVTLPLPLASSTVALDKDPNMLGEVVVKSGPALRQKAGKFIFNPTDLYKRSTDAFSVLQYAPLLEVDDSRVSILGKGASKIYINGKDPNMDTQSVMIMLKALPPQDIKRIEIITSPGASQAAANSGGIVNVVLDKPYEGYLGYLSGGIKYRSARFSPNLSFLNAYTVGKFRMLAIIYYQNPNYREVNDNAYNYSDINRTVTNHSAISSHYNFVGGGLSLTYDFTPLSMLNVVFTTMGGTNSLNSLVECSETSAGRDPVNSTSRIYTRSPFTTPEYNLSASYSLKLKKIKGQLDIQSSFSSQRELVNTDYLFSSLLPIHQRTDAKSSGVHLKPSYKQKFGSIHSLEIGYDLLRSTIDNDYQYPGHDNQFKYTEMINSIFLNWSATWSDAFHTSVGLRMENTDIDTRQLVNNERNSRNYTDLFPNLSAGINLPGGDDQSLSLSINRHISRPYYDLLNPFVYWTSPTTYSKGNTQLNPGYKWQYNIYCSFLRYFTLGLTYTHTSDAILDYVYTDGDGNTVSSSDNFGSSRFFSASLSVNKALTDKWYLKSHITGYHISEDATILQQDLGFKSTFFNLGLNNNITLSEKYSCYLDVIYTLASPSTSLIGKTRYENYLSIEFKKRFRSGLSLSVSANNLLDARRTINFTTPAYSYSERLKYNHQQFEFKVAYLFGKKSVRTGEDRQDSAFKSRFKE